MSEIKVLDCTLRDGGYCNNWSFGKNNIVKIVDNLAATGIDYIECGFLTNKITYDENKSKYSKMSELTPVISTNLIMEKCLLMLNYGEYELDDLPDCSESPISGIRVAFHKRYLNEALDDCKRIKEKGYRVFVQPMVSLAYTDKEFTELIESVNTIDPYAFYIVDSFGSMKRADLIRLTKLAQNNLKEGISLGFHAHNNLQLAYSNAQYLSELELKRELIVDVSIHGMGRGAGNLNAELFLEYLNSNKNAQYDIKPILNVMDEIISRFYEEKPWGYSLPNYLSAAHLIHPNYAKYLDEKKTLTLEAMDDIFNLIEPERGIEYDEQYIEQKYIDYLSSKESEELFAAELERNIKGKEVLLIASGKSVEKEKEKIVAFARKEVPLVISLNHDYPYFTSDYIFVSNQRRFRQLNPYVYSRTIVTSNIKTENVLGVIKYHELLNPISGVRDNVGLMAIKMLIQYGASKVFLAGYDGYSDNVFNDYENKDMVFLRSTDGVDNLNKNMAGIISGYSKKIPIEFLTKSIIQEIVDVKGM